jgi:cellobiose PTS system EIIA component
VADINKLLQTGMHMIASAGDGRTLIAQAVEAAGNRDYENADKYFEEAFENIKTAHIAQTKEIQDAMSDDEKAEEAARLLFTHAQDTLMTINSEYILSKQMIELLKKLDERLSKVEEKVNG